MSFKKGRHSNLADKQKSHHLNLGHKFQTLLQATNTQAMALSRYKCNIIEFDSG